MATVLDAPGPVLRNLQGATRRSIVAVGFDRLDRDRHRRLPNRLSYSRGILCPPLFVAGTLLSGHGQLRLGLAVFAIGLVWMGLSDLLDGSVARLLNITSTSGESLDPAMDKLAGSVAYLSFMLLVLTHLSQAGHDWLIWSVCLRVGLDGLIAALAALVLLVNHLNRRKLEAPALSNKARVWGKLKFGTDCVGLAAASSCLFWLNPSQHPYTAAGDLLTTAALIATPLAIISLLVHVAKRHRHL